MDKRADGGLTVIVIIIVLVAIAWGISFSGRECSSSDDCIEGQFCNSNFECKSYPTIEKTVVKQDLTQPAKYLAAAMVLGAIIIRWPKKEKPNYNYYQNENHR